MYFIKINYKFLVLNERHFIPLEFTFFSFYFCHFLWLQKAENRRENKKWEVRMFIQKTQIFYSYLVLKKIVGMHVKKERKSVTNMTFKHINAAYNKVYFKQ